MYSSFELCEVLLHASLNLELMRKNKPFEVGTFSRARVALLEYSCNQILPPAVLQAVASAVAKSFSCQTSNISLKDVREKLVEVAGHLHAADAGEFITEECQKALVEFLVGLQIAVRTTLHDGSHRLTRRRARVEQIVTSV